MLCNAHVIIVNVFNVLDCSLQSSIICGFLAVGVRYVSIKRYFLCDMLVYCYIIMCNLLIYQYDPNIGLRMCKNLIKLYYRYPFLKLFFL